MNNFFVILTNPGLFTNMSNIVNKLLGNRDLGQDNKIINCKFPHPGFLINPAGRDRNDTTSFVQKAKLILRF